MNKILQDTEEMQDEELYALLDKAMETERLCVSEELIQKTLKRVAEEDGSNVISLNTVKKRRNVYMRYGCVAAAAVLILLVGVRSFAGKSFSVEDAAPMEASRENGIRKTESSVMYDGAEENESGYGALSDFYYSTSESLNGDSVDSEDYAEAPEAETRGSESAMRGGTVVLSERLTQALTDAGMMPLSTEAECWEFVYREESWEAELLNCLIAGTVLENELPETGRYGYLLAGADGRRETISCNEPLDIIVCIRTEQGMLWGLLGESAVFYTE